jgi:excisionase family DNA binding protein
MPIAGYYTTAEAAEKLGLSQPAMQNAVRRGALRAEKIARRILIPAAEVERYAREVQGTQGWDKRKQPDYTPNTKQRTYQQAYYQRKKALRKQQPTMEPAERE